MTPPWERVLEVFQAASDLEASERSAFLDKACGDDPALRKEVEKLLAGDSLDSELLQSPSSFSIPEALKGKDFVNTRLGQYHLKRVISSGGMGTVYEAIQEHPRRAVAVKVMKEGIASRSALRRFEYESQILARLRHPGIAQVFEAGTHREGGAADSEEVGGVPYFVMEYVPSARTITDYAQHRKLGMRERLQLFRQVCEAVHHGHQKGIIHRDLKPANILVDSHGQVKIIDFGVARATDSDMALTTLQTDVGQLIGTMQYMSPEQCEADPHDLDTRSDVYALGVLLYELLCEKLPYDVSTASIYEAVRLIQEEQPERPSTTNRILRGDVETVTLKALEKDRERRYQSADELSRDIAHYLKGEPILARPPSLAYQLSIFARNNKALVGGIVAVFIVLVAGIIVSTTLYVQTESAYAETEKARKQAESDRAAAEESRAKATSEAEAAKAINKFFNEMLASVDPTQIRMFSGLGSNEQGIQQDSERFALHVSVAEMMRRAVPRIPETFAGKPELEAVVCETLGTTFMALGFYDDAKPQLKSALDIRGSLLNDDDPNTLRSQVQLGKLLWSTSEYERAEQLLFSALKRMQRVFGKEHPNTLTCARILAMSQFGRGKYAESDSIFTETLEIQRRVLGEDHQDTIATMCFWSLSFLFRRSASKGLPLIIEAHELSLRAHSPDDFVTIHSEVLLGWWRTSQGFNKLAETHFRSTLEKCQRILGEEHPFTFITMRGLARSLSAREFLEERERLFRKALSGLRSTVGEGHHQTTFSYVDLLRFLSRQERFDEAEELWRQRLESSSKTLGEEANSTMHLMDGFASFLLKRKRPDEAREYVEKALASGRRLVKMPNASIEDLNDFAWLLLTCNPVDLQDPEAALLLAQKAAEQTGWKEDHILDTLALAYYRTGDKEKAVEMQRRAIAALPSGDSINRIDYEKKIKKYLSGEEE